LALALEAELAAEADWETLLARAALNP